MKPLLLILLLTTALISTAQINNEQQIRSILNAQVRAWNQGNIDAFMKAYWQNDSLMFISSNGITYGYKATLEGYHQRYPDTDAMGQLSFTILKVKRISNNNYFVIGKWFLKREKKGDIGGHFTLLWEKRNGEWVIVADHTS